MKVGFEARWISDEKTGFGNYALNLLKELSDIDDKNEYLVYLNKDYENNKIFSKSNFNKIVIRKRPEMYKHVYIPLDITRKKRKIDLFHFLYNAPSLITPCPFIVTIHDVSYKYFPRMISLKNRLSILSQLHLNAKRARRIITVSDNSKKDIIKFFNVPEDKIEVIYEGVDDSFKRIREDSEQELIIQKYSLPPKYLLYVGTYLPHKNLETLLKAYQKLRHHLKIPHSLVLAGKKGRNFEEIANLIFKLNLNSDVKTIGFVPDEDLPYIYNLSDIFIFPSLYEGFGLPILEAMSCGVPVVASKSSCLPEIGGDAAVYFSQKDVGELAEKISEIIKDPSFHAELSEKGIQRAKIFSWRRMAEKTLEVYEHVGHELSSHEINYEKQA